MEAELLMFDFGGTIDTNGIHWSELFWDYYTLLGINIDRELYDYGYVTAQKQLDSEFVLSDKSLRDTILLQLNLQNHALYRKTARNYLSFVQIEWIARNIYDFVNNTIAIAIDTIKSLNNNRKLAIVSNFNGNLKLVCEEFGLTEIFDYLIDSAIVKLWKPDPKIFKYCLDTAGVDACKSVVIGDSYSRDITPAKSIGCNTIWLNKKSWEKPENTNNADLIIETFEELNQIFKKTMR